MLFLSPEGAQSTLPQQLKHNEVPVPVLHTTSHPLQQQQGGAVQAAPGSTTPASAACQSLAARAWLSSPATTYLDSSHAALNQYWQLPARKARGECVGVLAGV